MTHKIQLDFATQVSVKTHLEGYIFLWLLTTRFVLFVFISLSGRGNAFPEVSLRTQVRHHRLCCLRVEFTRIKADVALLGAAKPPVIYKDIKYIFYDYDDAKNFVDDNIVTLEGLNITTRQGSRQGKRNQLYYFI